MDLAVCEREGLAKIEDLYQIGNVVSDETKDWRWIGRVWKRLVKCMTEKKVEGWGMECLKFF